MNENPQRERRLRRGRRCWDRVSSLEGKAGTDRRAAPISTYALDHLDVRTGDAVLDIGCGAGNNLPDLRAAVGPTGQVVGIDYSTGMLARAERQIRNHGWDNVVARQVDFTRTEIEADRFDAALASFSLSAMPDVPTALANAHTALRPGGRLFVIDMRLIPAGWSTPLIWFFQGVYRALAGWSGVDVLDTARATFASVDLPDPPGKPGRGQPTAGWPPLTTFVATKPDESASGFRERGIL